MCALAAALHVSTSNVQLQLPSSSAKQGVRPKPFVQVKAIPGKSAVSILQMVIYP